MDYVNDLLNALSANWDGLTAFFGGAWGLKQVALAGIAAALLLGRQWGAAILYAFVVFFAWGVLDVMGQVDQENFRTFVLLMSYLTFGAGVVGTLYYLFFIREAG